MTNFMKLLDPYRWLIGGVLIASVVAAFFWYRHSLIAEGREAARVEYADKAAKQLELARAQTANMQEVKDEAIEQASKRAQANARAAAGARTELAKLRDELARNPSVSGDTCAAAVDRASALGSVFAECAGELETLAGKADAHANDAATIYAAWPEYKEFNDRLTTFANNLKGTK